jgi:hypothetical protein
MFINSYPVAVVHTFPHPSCAKKAIRLLLQVTTTLLTILASFFTSEMDRVNASASVNCRIFRQAQECLVHPKSSV